MYVMIPVLKMFTSVRYVHSTTKCTKETNEIKYSFFLYLFHDIKQMNCFVVFILFFFCLFYKCFIFSARPRQYRYEDSKQLMKK